jgi:hypothetical protein
VVQNETKQPVEQCQIDLLVKLGEHTKGGAAL